jgi:hypothetical protein
MMNRAPISRSDFLRRLVRGGLLAGLGVAGWRAAGGRKALDRSGQTCINKSVCCNCHVYRQCELPAAQSAKLAQKDRPS